MGPRRSQLALLLTVLAAVFRAGSSATCADQCVKLNDLPCDANEGCMAGKAMTATTDGSPLCTRIECSGDDGSFLHAHYLGGELSITPLDKILCNDQKQWMDENEKVVDQAVCIIKFVCSAKNPLLASPCDDPTFEAPGCVKATIGADDVKCGASTKKLYFKGENPSDSWTEVAKAPLNCDPESGEWMDTGTNPFGAGSVICADSPPIATCTLCPQFTPNLNCVNEGCKTISTPLEPGFTATNCKKLTCDGGFFHVNYVAGGTPSGNPVYEIECGSTKNWLDDSMNPKPFAEAVCITGFSCSKRNPLTSVCDATKTKAPGCSKPLGFAGDSDKNCQAPSKLYFKGPGATSTWEQVTGTDLKCDSVSGEWMDSENKDLPRGAGELICATEMPKPAPTDCSDSTLAPKSICDSSIEAFVGCQVIQPFNPATPVVPCVTNGLRIFRRVGAAPWIELSDVTCKSPFDSFEAQFLDNTITGEQISNADNVVCAKHPPDSKACTTKGMPNIGCDGLVGCNLVDLKDESALACTPGDLYLKKFGDGEKWQKADKIQCNLVTGNWDQEPTSGPIHHLQVQVPNQDHVVCATKDPTPTPCTVTSPLTSCPVPPPPGCVDASFVDNVPLTCGTQKLFVQRSNTLHWEAPKGDNIKCNLETGEWEEGTSSVGLQKLDGSAVVCADSAPPGPCPNLDLKCDDAWVADPILCSTATPYNNPVCATGNNIYFMKGTTKFQEATSIICNGGEWELKYNRGSVEETEKLVDGDYLICAKSNPHPGVCQYITGTSTKGIGAKYVSDNWKTAEPEAEGVEAGKTASCRLDYDEFYTQTGLSRSLNAPPICDTSSKWMMYEDGKFVDFGPTVGCKTAKCKKCPNPEPPNPRLPPAISSSFASERGSPLKFDPQGSCAELRCDKAEPKFVIKESNNDMIRYYTGPVTCSDEGTWHFGSESKEVEEIECVQQWHCADPNDPDDKVLKAKFECPAGIPTDQGCINPSVIDHSNVECTAPKKMFVKGDSEVWWYEIATTKITCDVKRGEWKMTLLGQTAADKEFRGPENTFICADQNPNPEPPPIATTTPAPREICELCKDYLPPLKCDKCSNSSLIFERECEKCPDVCIMKSSNEKEYTLLINGNQIPPGKILNCTRPVANDEGTPDPKWRTTDGVDVAEVSARREMAAKKWVGGQYGILAGALFFIGAMGLGCVLIYFRMRKKPSLREKKKKERGVTKKYTSANVIKTGGRSERGSKEGGKSMEPTKSKAEDNNSNLDEAPTLKL